MSIEEIVDDFPESEFRISVGGPVSNNTVHFIHTLGEQIPDSVAVTDGIYWGGDFDHIKELIASGAIKPMKSAFSWVMQGGRRVSLMVN